MLINPTLAAKANTWITGLYVFPDYTLMDAQGNHTWLWYQVAPPLKHPILQSITANVLRSHNTVIERSALCL